MVSVIYTTATYTGNGQAATRQVQGPVVLVLRIDPARLASSTSGVSFIRRLNSESSICNWCNLPHSHTKPCYGRSRTKSCSDSWFSKLMGQLGKRGAVCRAIRPRLKGQRRHGWLHSILAMCGTRASCRGSNEDVVPDTRFLYSWIPSGPHMLQSLFPSSPQLSRTTTCKSLQTMEQDWESDWPKV